MRNAKGPIATYPNGGRTEIWRQFSWRLGDAHANRICWLLDLYRRFYKIDIRRFQSYFPRG